MGIMPWDYKYNYFSNSTCKSVLLCNRSVLINYKFWGSSEACVHDKLQVTVKILSLILC